MKSGNYPTVLMMLIINKGQFEGVEIGQLTGMTPIYRHRRYSHAQGLQKLEGALTTLDGRDRLCKGQAITR